MKEGTLYINKEKHEIFLFTDALLYCKRSGKEKLKYKGMLALPTSTINTRMYFYFIFLLILLILLIFIIYYI